MYYHKTKKRWRENMRFNELIGMLQNKYEIRLLMSDDFPSAIKDIRLLDQNEGYWNEHTLYVGRFDQLNNLPDRPIMLLCIDEPNALPKGSSCAQIQEDDLYQLFNTAKDLIVGDLKEGSMLYELAHLALNGKNISSVINTAASLLGNALIFVDYSQKVLAYSTNYEIVDKLWVENIAKGHCSYEFVQKVRSNNQMREWRKQGSETQIITLPGDKQRKLVARITQEGHVAGAIVMIEHHTPIARSHIRQLPLVGRILFDVFFRDSASSSMRGAFYSNILYSLLDDMDNSDTIEYLNASENEFPTEMHVVVARFVTRVENRFLKRAVSMALERIFPQGYSVLYKSYIGILVPSILKAQLEELEELTKLESVSIGLSWPFNNILEFKRYFNQAVISIKLAQRLGQTQSIFDYSDFHYYDLLNNYTGKIPLEYYCHPALQLLRQYDRDNKSDLYNTLYTYLENGKSLVATAEKLFIHRNTLVYRINRIIQLTGLELDNVNVVHSLMDSFRIMAFLNK
jgi:hypothetical protein